MLLIFLLIYMRKREMLLMFLLIYMRKREMMKIENNLFRRGKCYNIIIASITLVVINMSFLPILYIP
jgi:hypothetical protein